MKKEMFWFLVMITPLLALFLLFVFLSNGYVPVIGKLEFVYYRQPGLAREALNYNLPWAISRAWDVVALGIFALLLIRGRAYFLDNQKEADLNFRRLVVFSYSSLIIVLAALSAGQTPLFGYAISLGFNLIFALIWSVSSRRCFKFDVFFDGFIALFSTIIIGVEFGLVIAAVFSFGVFFVFFIVSAIGQIVSEFCRPLRY